MQRTVTRSTLHTPQQVADVAYWLTQPVQARIDALETLRRQHHTDFEFKVQRVYRVTPLKPG